MDQQTGFRDPQAGVFSDIVDDAAFIDRLRFGIDGERRVRPLPEVSVTPSFPIGGPYKPYARAENGVCVQTENPFQLRYGRNALFRNLPLLSLDMRSEKRPLTLNEFNTVANSLIRGGYREYISRLEWTFDLSGTSVEFIRNHYVSRATYFRELADARGFRTIYVGSPASPWQMKAYDKFGGVVRVEYTLRRQALRGLCITRPGAVSLLGNLDPASLAGIWNLDRTGLGDVLGRVRKEWRRELLLNWRPQLALQIWATAMRGCKVNPTAFLAECDAQRRVREMNKKLVW